MSKHTRGPWKAHEYESPRGYYFVKSETTTEKIAGGQSMDCEANAKLIAAAPELLELARQYASECAECGGDGGSCPECADIRAVIAKAVSHS